MERGVAMEEEQRGMERDAGWGSRKARDWVRGGEDGSSERTVQ
jgi:hypothetical protein